MIHNKHYKPKFSRLALIETIEGIDYKGGFFLVSDPAEHILDDFRNTPMFDWAIEFVNTQQAKRAWWLHAFLVKVASRTPGCTTERMLLARPGLLYYG